MPQPARYDKRIVYGRVDEPGNRLLIVEKRGAYGGLARDSGCIRWKIYDRPGVHSQLKVGGC